MVVRVLFTPTYAAKTQGHEVSSTIFSIKLSSWQGQSRLHNEHAAQRCWADSRKHAYPYAYLAILIGPPGCPGRTSSICCGRSVLLRLPCHLQLSPTGSGRGACGCFSHGITLQKAHRHCTSHCKLSILLEAAILSISPCKKTDAFSMMHPFTLTWQQQHATMLSTMLGDKSGVRIAAGHKLLTRARWPVYLHLYAWRSCLPALERSSGY